MRKNFGAAPICYPQPVFMIATYDEAGVPNVMNAAWGGISGMKTVSICVDAGHKTMENIKKRKAFTVSMADADHVVSCDYVGIVSGNDVPDKFEKAGFHAAKSEFVDAPVIEELPLVMECRLLSYDEETEILTGEILNVGADARILNEKGTVDPQKLRPITFDPSNNKYLVLGDAVGNAFRDGLQLK